MHDLSSRINPPLDPIHVFETSKINATKAFPYKSSFGWSIGVLSMNLQVV